MPPEPSSPQIRILMVEDHDMVADAMCIALERAEDLKVVARGSSTVSALAYAREHRPDVVLLDRRLPDGDGIEVIEALREAAPGARVLVLSGEATVATATRVTEAGGSGLILKSDNLTELEHAVRQVASGEVAFSKGLLRGVLERLSGRAPGLAATLTRRERETLSLLGEGLRGAEISERMGVALNTVRNHIQQVLRKLGANSQLEAVATARREGLIP